MKIGLTGCKILVGNEHIISGGIVIDLASGTIESIREGSLSRTDVDILVELSRRYYVVPGFVDIHVHCRDDELSHKETIETCTEAAAAAGVVLIFDMPNTSPPLNTPERIERRLEQAESKSRVEYRIHAGVPEGLDLDLVDEYHRVGVHSIKIYPEDYERLSEKRLLEKFLEKVKKYDILLIAHCEDLDIVREKETTIERTFSNHNKIRPEEAEISAVKELLKSCYKAKVRRIHITHVSSPETIRILRNARRLIPGLSFDVTPHHLFICQEECLSSFRDRPGICKVNPPLRDYSSRNLMFSSLAKGEIECIASDHAPHTLEEKLQPYDRCPPGFPGLETTSILLLNLWRRELLSLQDVVRLYSWKPSRICNVMEPTIKPGAPAYLTVIKVGEEHRVRGNKFKSKAKYTPFEGVKVDSRIVLTVVRERVAYVDESDSRLRELKDYVKSG